MSQTVFADWGVMLLETDVDALVIQQLRAWLPNYLRQAEVERHLARHLLARPTDASFQNVLESADFPEAQLPAIVVTTANTTGEPQSNFSRQYGANWGVVVSAIVRGRTAPETRALAALFGGCVRRILVHQQLDLDAEVRWMGGNVAPVADETDQGRYLAAGINTFTVYTDQALGGDGPVHPEPDDDPVNPPYDPLPLVRPGGVITTILPRS